MKTNIGIYSENVDKSIAKAIEIVEESEEFIVRGSFAKPFNKVVETDTMIVKVLSPIESSRGHKNHEIYVDRNIGNEIRHNIIYPTLIPKFNRDGLYDENYRYLDHIHYF